MDEVIDEFIYQTEPNRTNINWITGESLESILNISLSYFCELLKESKKDVSFIYNIYGKPVREFYYRAGKCEKEIYRDYKGNNLCKYEIYENEVLMQKYVYLNCKPDDINTYLYFPNGQLQMATQIRGNNIKQGKWIEYYKNGNKKQVINYDKGEPTGSWTTYYENGNKKFQESYRMGKLNGKVKKWDIEGNITEIVKYKNGKKVD